MRMESQRRLFGCFCAIMVWFCSSGVMQGWGSLYQILHADGQYSELCPVDDSSCREREETLQHIYWHASIAASYGACFFGILLDLVGARFCAIFGIMISLCGNVLMGLGNSKTFDVFIPAVILIMMGGTGPYLAAMSFADVFPQQRSLYVSIMASLFNFGAFMYITMNQLSSRLDVGRQALFFGYAAIEVIIVLLAVAFIPTHQDRKTKRRFRLFCSSIYKSLFRAPFSPASPADGTALPHSFVQSTLTTPVAKRGSRIDWKEGKTKFKSLMMRLWNEAKRPEFYLLCLFYSISLTVISFYAGATPDMMKQKGDDPDNPIYLSVLFPLLSNMHPVFAPIVGYVIDKWGFPWSFGLSAIFLQIVMGLTLVPSLPLQILSFVLFALNSGFMFASFFASLTLLFDSAVCGQLYAIVTGVATAIGCLNMPLITYTQQTENGDYTNTYTILIAITFVLYVYPVFLFYKSKESKLSKLAATVPFDITGLEDEAEDGVPTLSAPLLGHGQHDNHQVVAHAKANHDEHTRAE